MRTSLNEIKQIEKYLQQELSTGDRIVFEARLLLDNNLRKKVRLQSVVYALVKHHASSGIKRGFSELYHRMSHDPLRMDMNEKIIQLFKS